MNLLFLYFIQGIQKNIANKINSTLANNKYELTNDNSNLTVNEDGLVLQDKQLSIALQEDLLIIPILGWYPASKNSNTDTNGNATTLSLKKKITEFTGINPDKIFIYWIDVWQYCHKSTNQRINFDQVKNHFKNEKKHRKDCIDMLKINITIFRQILSDHDFQKPDKVPFVVNGGSTRQVLNLLIKDIGVQTEEIETNCSNFPLFQDSQSNHI